MRAFIAIEIPPTVRAALSHCRAELARLPVTASWTRPEAIHLTLKFLGEIPETSTAVVAQKLEQAASDSRAFHLQLAGLGAFPNLRRPRVLWAGLAGEVAPAQQLQLRLERELEAAGFPREEKPWKPHLTLARLKSVENPRAFTAGVEAYRLPELPFEVDRVLLFRSELHPSGARYTELAAAALAR